MTSRTKGALLGVGLALAGFLALWIALAIIFILGWWSILVFAMIGSAGAGWYQFEPCGTCQHIRYQHHLDACDQCRDDDSRMYFHEFKKESNVPRS